MLPTLKLVGRYDTIDGLDVVELQGTSEDVSLTMWIAPSLNYALKKIEYRPSIPDNVTAEDVNRVPSHTLYVSVFNQFKKLADNYVPQQIDVHFVASGYHLRDGKVHPSPRKPIDAKFDVSWSVEVVSAPLSDDDFKVSMEIPDGTRVQMDDAPSLNYVWRNGEVVPSKE